MGSLLLGLPIQAWAATYYIADCQAGAATGCKPGNDANPGTSASAPWRTVGRIPIASLNGNDKVLFAKGGSWVNASMRMFNTKSRAASPITFASYTASWKSTARPILTESRSGTNLFIFEDGGNADHDEGYIIRDLEMRGKGTGKWAVFLYNDVDHVTIENVKIDGFSIGIHNGGSNTANAGSNGKNDFIKIRNSVIVNNGDQGYLGGGNDILIEGNTFDNNGFRLAIYNHNIYVSRSNRVIVRNNKLTRSAIVAGKCQGVSLVVHGVNTGIVIENNHISETSAAGTCYGISADPGYSTAESLKGTIIRGNKVINVGAIGIGAASCPDCLIENNVIVQDNPVTFVGIAIPDNVRQSIDAADTRARVRNNTILIRKGTASSYGIRVGKEGTGVKVMSNLILFGMASHASSTCFDITGLTRAAFHIFDYNLCRFNSGAGRWEKTHPTLASFQAIGLDRHSTGEDPKMLNPYSPYNLNVSSSSPAVNAGHPYESAPKDIKYKARDAMPDIGAYEY